MLHFNKSYATSEQLEMSRIAASSSPSSQQQLSTSLLRSSRHIPPELRAPPYVPGADTLEATEDDTDAPFDQRRKPEQQLPEDPFTGKAASPSLAPSSTSEPGQERRRARTSQIGKMLFPSTLGIDNSSRGSPRTKRHSYSESDSALPKVVLNPLSASTSSLPDRVGRLPPPPLGNATKKAQSPTNSHSRTTSLAFSAPSSSSQSSASTSLAIVNDDTLLALPLAKQLHSLKERNSELARESSTNHAELVRATERIRHLEETLASVESSRGVDAEGWEAEASRLAQELALLQRQQAERPNVDDLESRAGTAERSLAVEQSKKRRAREMINKLRCELNNRRWKEKYEIELLEKEERNWEIRVAETDCETAILRGELECVQAERQELESIVALQKHRISTLIASKKVLLDSFEHSEETVCSLRSSLATAHSTAAERERQVAKYQEDIFSLEKELGDARTTSGAGEAKVLEKNRQLEEELKDAKSQVKVAQSARRSTEKANTSVTSILDSTREALSALQAKYDALLSNATHGTSPESHSISIVKARQTVKEKKRLQPGTEPESDVEVDVESEEVAVPDPSPKRSGQVKGAKSKGAKVADGVEKHKKKKNAEPVAEEEDPEESSAGKAAKSVKLAIPDVQEGEEDKDDDDDEETPRPTPVSPPPAKKRKADVLADKSTNAKKDKGASTGTTKVKKAKSGAKKQKLALDLSEDEAPPAPKDDPAKKKKRKLFGDGAKKGFDWQTQIENADVNGSLIPGNLSPIKLDKSKGKKTGALGFGLGGGIKKSIF
ncbi:hypothetical protein JCM11491_005886 [Sporobolomyces phaffii]